MNFFKKIKSVLSLEISEANENKSGLPGIAVCTSFDSRYPLASDVEWSQIDPFKWRVEFLLNKKRCSTLFDSQGEWLETVTVLPMESVPEIVQFNFEKSYAKTGVINIHQVEMVNRTIYEIAWSSGIFSWKLLYDITGKIIGKLII